MMDRQSIRDTISEAKLFITAAEEVLKEMDTNKEWVYDGTNLQEVTKRLDMFHTGRRSTGTLRRRSMDLTRALADLRRTR